jgi:DNA-binding beta-propeller fold protein YncE
VFLVLGVLLKRASIFFFFVLLASLWTSCGGGNNGNSTQTSGIKDRALFDNAENGGISILNIDTNPVSVFGPVAALTSPRQMIVSPDKAFVLIYDDAAFSISIFNTSAETVGATLAVNSHTDSIVLASDGKHAYAAVPDVPQQNPPNGAVLTYDLTTAVNGAVVPVPNARRLAISPDGKSLLAFADNDNNVYYIDLTATSLKAVTIPGFNNPYTAYFASDNTTAYVLNCGTECSGSVAPSVQKLTVSPSGQTVGGTIPVTGATVGLLDGNTLYVAGNDVTQPIGSQGVLTKVDVSAMTAAAPVAIADGLHNKMVSFGGKLWIGSWDCTTGKCLSIAPVSGGNATIGSTVGDVTAITPAPAKGWVYVMQGAVHHNGELYQYDPNSLNAISPFDIVGSGWDIKLLDQ